MCARIRVVTVIDHSPLDLARLATALAEGSHATPGAFFALRRLIRLRIGLAGDRRAAPTAGLGRPFIAPSGRADLSLAKALDHHFAAAWLDAASGSSMGEEL
jgi:hypothetical protein